MAANIPDNGRASHPDPKTRHQPVNALPTVLEQLSLLHADRARTARLLVVWQLGRAPRWPMLLASTCHDMVFDDGSTIGKELVEESPCGGISSQSGKSADTKKDADILLSSEVASHPDASIPQSPGSNVLAKHHLQSPFTRLPVFRSSAAVFIGSHQFLPAHFKDRFLRVRMLSISCRSCRPSSITASWAASISCISIFSLCVCSAICRYPRRRCTPSFQFFSS